MVEKPKQKMRLDMMSFEDVGDLKLGTEVTVTVTGKIASLRGPEISYGYDYAVPSGKISSKEKKEEPHLYPGDMCVEVGTVKMKVNGKFDAMDQDD